MRGNDLTEKIFGRLTVVCIDNTNTSKNRYWKVKCSCGKIKSIRGDQLLSGHTNSCGCLRVEVNTTHGLSSTPEYKIWKGMKERCFLKLNKDFYRYGGRGITMSDRWKNSFSNFIKDMGKRPSNKHSIERTNNNGNYEVSNCKWATDHEQTRNKSNNRLLTHNGKTMIISDWAKETGLNRLTIKTRIDILGWSISRALTEKQRGK